MSEVFSLSDKSHGKNYRTQTLTYVHTLSGTMEWHIAAKQ